LEQGVAEARPSEEPSLAEQGAIGQPAAEAVASEGGAAEEGVKATA
jgi:hypothetical protein